MEKINHKLEDYLLEQGGEYIRELIVELNSWNGCLEYLYYHDNDEEFFDTYFEGRTYEAVRASQYGDYSFSDRYVKFDGYSNLESTNSIMDEFSDNIEEIVECLLSYWGKISIDDHKLFTMLTESDELEEE